MVPLYNNVVDINKLKIYILLYPKKVYNYSLLNNTTFLFANVQLLSYHLGLNHLPGLGLNPSKLKSLKPLQYPNQYQGVRVRNGCSW